jgi:hypothetical protein
MKFCAFLENLHCHVRLLYCVNSIVLVKLFIAGCCGTWSIVKEKMV